MKLHNLVYVHYNLRLRIQRATATVEASEFDPATSFMDLSLYRQTRPIEEWMQHGRSNRAPTLDEDSDFADPPVPAQILTDLARRVGEPVNVDDWARENIGDTHLGKTKTKIPPSQSKRKNKERVTLRRKALAVTIAHQSLVMMDMVVVVVRMMMTTTTSMMMMAMRVVLLLVV